MNTESRDSTLSLKQDERVVDTFERLEQAVRAPRLTDEQVWLSMWTAVANAWNCNSEDAATRWADNGLAHFRKRFQDSAPNDQIQRRR